MGTYTTQLSLGSLQYERLMQWMFREKYPGKIDSFIREKFMELLDKEQPSEQTQKED